MNHSEETPVDNNKQEPTPDMEEDAVPADEPDRIIELEAELEASNERTLRLAAELENVRKRSKQAEDNARRYGVSRFAEDMLIVADNLYRALDNVPPEVRLEASERMNQLVEGVEMTQKALQSGLERHGVKQISPKGEKFDHHLHQAVAQVPSAEFPSGIVAEVIQHGYQIADRVLRAAMVTVSTGAPAGEPSPLVPEPDAKPGSTIDTKA